MWSCRMGWDKSSVPSFPSEQGEVEHPCPGDTPGPSQSFGDISTRQDWAVPPMAEGALMPGEGGEALGTICRCGEGAAGKTPDLQTPGCFPVSVSTFLLLWPCQQGWSRHTLVATGWCCSSCSVCSSLCSRGGPHTTPKNGKKNPTKRAEKSNLITCH